MPAQTPSIVRDPRAASTRYPLRFAAARPERFTRVQLLVRFAAFVVLGTLGLSFAGIFAVAYVALPVYAATRATDGEGTPGESAANERRVLGLLRWLAAVSAWFGLVADRLPAHAPEESISLTLAGPPARPTPAAAILRIFTGLPSALVLMVLGCVGVLVWMWAALSILFTERVGPGAFAYLQGLQRWSLRLLAYQASLVDEYPPFALGDEPA